MAMKTTEREIVALEDAYWRAIQKKDVDAALSLTADPCIVTGPQGFAQLDHKTYAQMAQSDTWQLHRYQFLGEPAVTFASPDVAVIAYKVQEEMTVEGKPLTLQAAESSTWLRRDGKWLCVAHTEALLGDPFGRDKVMKPANTEPLAQQDAVANLAVKDLGKARKFYEETVGLTPIHHEGEEVIVYRSGNSTVNVYRSEFAGTNRATAVTWTVSNIEDVVKDLKSKGVTFEHYQMPETELKGDVHVSGNMKVAWFKDPDGNILNLISP